MQCVILSQSKKTYGYRERDELKRQEFQERLKTAGLPAQLVYVDLAKASTTALEYPCLLLRDKQRFHAFKSGKRSERVAGLRRSSREVVS